MLTFEKNATTEYYVAIFEYTWCEVVLKCPAHDDKFVRLVKEMEEE
jgi:hypothetical protein